MSKDVKKLTLAELDTVSQDERYALYDQFVVKPAAVVKKAQKAVKAVTLNAMKLVARLKRDHAELLRTKAIPQDTTETKFFAEYCGGQPSARLKQLATFFNGVTYREKPLIPENFIDAASVNSLELAAGIISKERELKKNAWETTDVTLDVINALSTPGEATEKLREIKAEQKGEKNSEEEPTGKTLTSVLVMMLKNRIIEAQDNDEGYATFVACQELAEAWSGNKTVPAARYAEWLKRRESEAVQITRGETAQDQAPAAEEETAQAHANA